MLFFKTITTTTNPKLILNVREEIEGKTDLSRRYISEVKGKRYNNGN